MNPQQMAEKMDRIVMMQAIEVLEKRRRDGLALFDATIDNLRAVLALAKKPVDADADEA